MTLTAEEIGRLRARWRRLAQLAVAAAPELSDVTREALDWASPIEAKGGAFVLFSLAWLAHAWARSGEAERTRLRPALALLAATAGDVLDATGPADPAQGWLWWAGD